MAAVERAGVGLKVGQEFVSRFGTNLRLTITQVSKKEISFKVQRRVIDRKTGEVLVEERERTTTPSDWKHVAAGYVPARKA